MAIITSLGIPASNKGSYARNPWAMIFFSGRLFIGSGNASQRPSPNSSPNAGPCDVWSYDGSSWTNEYTVDEEQIDHFVVLDGTLIVPGTDTHTSSSTESWYSRASDGTWTKHSNLLTSLHAFDMVKFGSSWFAGLGISGSLTSSAAAVSNDQGASWSRFAAPNGASADFSTCSGSKQSAAVRIYRYFTVNNVLYANIDSTNFFTCISGSWVAQSEYLYFVRWDGTQFVLESTHFVDPAIDDRLLTPIYLGSKTIYITGFSVNDEQWTPSSIRWVDGNLTPVVMSIPHCDEPRDMLLQDDIVYVLANQRTTYGYRVSVQSSQNLINWKEIFSFESYAFGRSFSYDASHNTFYIGMGAETTASIPAQNLIGTIYKIQPVRGVQYAFST